MSPSLHSANLAAILFVYNQLHQCNCTGSRHWLGFVISLFGIYQTAIIFLCILLKNLRFLPMFLDPGRYNPSQFREKEGYKPDIKLEYVDEAGRALTPKEVSSLI